MNYLFRWREGGGEGGEGGREGEGGKGSRLGEESPSMPWPHLYMRSPSHSESESDEGSEEVIDPMPSTAGGTKVSKLT